DRDDHLVTAIGGGRTHEPSLRELEEPVLPRQRRLAGEDHDAVLAELLERRVHREERAERISIGILVRGDEKPFVLADRRDDAIEVSLNRHLRLGSRRSRPGRAGARWARALRAPARRSAASS